MKKILGGILVLLSVILVGEVNAEVLDELGNKTITSTIGEVIEQQYPIYEINLSWDNFVFDYEYIDANYGYVWSNHGDYQSHVTIYSAGSPISAKFDWSSEIDGIGIAARHDNAACVELTDPEMISLIGKLEFYTDSYCNEEAETYVSGNKYYYYERTSEKSWYDSVTADTVIYNIERWSGGQGTANGLLNNTEFFIDGAKLYDNHGVVMWAPTYVTDTGVVFDFSLADTVRERDIESLKAGDTIGTLTITFGDSNF